MFQYEAGLAVNFQRYFTSKTKMKAVIIQTEDCRRRRISSLGTLLTERSEPSVHDTTVNELFLYMRQAKISEGEANS